MSSETDIAIADLTDAEIDEAVALWAASGLTRPWNDPRADIALALTSPSSTVLAGRRGGALLATTMVGFDGHRGWVYYLAVDGRYRRQGIGAAMMQAAENWLAAMGAPKLNLMVRTSNAAAVGFYRALGYDQSDVMVMQKPLSVS